VVAIFQGKGAKATELTLVKEVTNYQKKTVPIEYNGQARGNAIKDVLNEYERPFTIIVRRPPAKSIVERAAKWANDNLLGATEEPQTQEERELRQKQGEMTSINSEMVALQQAITSILSNHKKCWDWWMGELTGSDRNAGILTKIEDELNKNSQNLQDSSSLPSLELMGYKLSPTLVALSPGVYDRAGGSSLTCGKQHLQSFRDKLWQGNQVLPSVMIPKLYDEKGFDTWTQWLEFTLPKCIREGYERPATTFPFYFVEIGDLWLTKSFFSDGTETVLQKHRRIREIYKQVNEGPYSIAKKIDTKGGQANNLERNYKAWAADVSQVKSKKEDLDDRRKQREITFRECTGHAVLFPGDERNGPSNYSLIPQPTLLKYIEARCLKYMKYRAKEKFDVDKVGAVERNIRLDTEDKEKKELLLEEKTEKLKDAVKQSKRTMHLFNVDSLSLTAMNKLKLKYQGHLDKLNDLTIEEDKHLTEKNDQYKTKVAELKQKNIDDLTCGCLYKYIDIATALLYMGITRCLAKALACSAYNSDDPNSEAHLLSIPDIECWTGDHCFMAPAAVLGLCALYPTAMLTRPLFQALDEKLEFHFDYDYLFVFSQLQTFLLVASSFFPNTKEVLLLLCLFVDLVLLRFFMTPSGTGTQHNPNSSVLAHISSNKKMMPTKNIEAYKIGSFLLETEKGGKIVDIRPRKPGDTQGDGTLVLELEQKSFLLPRSVETFVNEKLIQRRNRRMQNQVEQQETNIIVHHEADPPAVTLANEVTVMAYDPPLLMAEREETSMESSTVAAHPGDDSIRREARTETVAHNLQSYRTNSVDKSYQDGDYQEQTTEGKPQTPDATIRSGACTAQPINKIAIVAFGFSAW
jgi:hypothetical protein